MNPEEIRLEDARTKKASWKRWGPYLSERQWGTVREDYSATGEAWDYFSHDRARSQTYRWGEDGIAGISDDRQLLCFAIALWNGKDPILKERLFGLTGNQGNHGEDVKEYYFYLDSTPTHSYMKYLYKYPQAAFPYNQLIAENQQRSRQEVEFELLDTGIFDDNRYFDVFVEYAKQSPEDILIQISIVNRGPETASLELLPTLWFRNDWSWTENANKPILKVYEFLPDYSIISASHHLLGTRYLYCDRTCLHSSDLPLLFTENETNYERIFSTTNASPYVKDGIDRYIVHNEKTAVNPHLMGTKVAPHYSLKIGAGETKVIKLRLCDTLLSRPNFIEPFGQTFDKISIARRQEADEFYRKIVPSCLSEDERNVHRQALAGMLWSKQYYLYYIDEWLKGDPKNPPPPDQRKEGRNQHWFHLGAEDIISMPDKWEYPWFAAWDLAFHTIPFATIDPDFAKTQLDIMTREWYMHPNGQIPAYEWNFSDVNPPVHAWATWRVYKIEQKMRGQGDRQFLERVFQKLLMNFTWWVNRKDFQGKNVFEGGFLGLDNIGVFDRSSPLPTGGYLEQSDGTSWMAMYCLNLLTIALELAKENPVYEDIATKFYEHFLYIAAAMRRTDGRPDELWDEEDGFFYDVLRSPQDSFRLKVRSMVGLIPLFAVMTIEPETLEKVPGFAERMSWFIQNRPEFSQHIACVQKAGVGARRLLAIVNQDRLRRILAKMLDESEFLSDYGIRALSRYHKEHPYLYHLSGQEFRVDYEPAESSTGLFGGNSNWRGPIWMPVNFLIIEALQKFYHYYGDDFKVECPTGSGNWMTLWEVAGEISKRLIRIFLKDSNRHRPLYREVQKFQEDPHWQDLILFYEYFQGDKGAGMGASHQTGWTGLVAKLLQQYG